MSEDYNSSPNIFHIGKKGVYVGTDHEILSVGSAYDRHWGRKLSPWERLHKHHTVVSASQHTQLRQRKKRGGDALDFTLRSVYDHSTYLFPSDGEIYRQKENVVKAAEEEEDEEEENFSPACQLTAGHEVVIGGIKERRSPHAVRLNLSSHHMSRTAGGYGRKVDGSFYAP